MERVSLVLALLASFSLGAIPTGVLVARLKGKDPRRGGSGNIGASNVARLFGPKLGLLTLLGDLLKGALPAGLTAWLLGEPEACGAALAAVIGHCYSPFLRFKGGKGVATAFGVLSVLALPLAAAGALVWVFVFFVTRVPTYSSLGAALTFAVVAHAQVTPLPLRLLTVCLLGLIVLRHRPNLKVLRAPRVHRRPRRRR